MAFNNNTFSIVAGSIAIAGVVFYLWDTRVSKLFTRDESSDNSGSVSSSNSGSVGGSKRRRIKQKNTRKRNYKK